MKVLVQWDKAMTFSAAADGQFVNMDAKAPIGQGSAPTPKELIGAAIGGCTGMDVMALLKKHRQLPESFQIHIEITTSVGKTPAVFEAAHLIYDVRGNVERATLSEAVQLSQTKYCGVSAMLSRAFPIDYRIVLNGEEVSEGRAAFTPGA